MIKNILQRILDYTEPVFIRGIIIGVVISILFGLIFSTGSMLMVFYGLIAIVIILVVGAILGNYIYNSQKNKVDKLVEERVSDVAIDFKETSIKLVTATLSSEREKELPEAIKNLGKSDASSEVIKLGIAAFTRFLSFTSLITVLGGLLSFALFIATYMQVKHLETQNKLIDGQNNKIDIQNSLAESSRRAGIVFELTSILEEIDEELDSVEETITKKGYFDINEIAYSIEDDLKNADGELDHGYMLYNTSIQPFLDTFSLSISVYPEYEKYYIQPKLSRRLEGRIIAISKALRPYKYLNEDNKLSDVYLSPERGQLLISLIESDVLTSQFIPKSDFTYSDLKGINIAKILDFNLNETELTVLQEIKLNYSDLENTDFNFIDFNNSEFNYSHFKNTTFDRCNLIAFTARESNIESVTITNSNLKDADFSKAKIGNLKIKNCNLDLISLKSTTIDTTIIKAGWLPESNLFGEIDTLKTTIQIIESYTNDSMWTESLNEHQLVSLDSVSFSEISKDEIQDLQSALIGIGVSATALNTSLYRVSCKILFKPIHQ